MKSFFVSNQHETTINNVVLFPKDLLSPRQLISCLLVYIHLYIFFFKRLLAPSRFPIVISRGVIVIPLITRPIIIQTSFSLDRHNEFKAAEKNSGPNCKLTLCLYLCSLTNTRVAMPENGTGIFLSNMSRSVAAEKFSISKSFTV